MRYDFKGGLRSRERTARLHLPIGAAQSPALTAELEVVEGLLKAAVVSSFESRAAAYEEEVSHCRAVSKAPSASEREQGSRRLMGCGPLRACCWK